MCYSSETGLPRSQCASSTNSTKQSHNYFLFIKQEFQAMTRLWASQRHLSAWGFQRPLHVVYFVSCVRWHSWSYHHIWKHKLCKFHKLKKTGILHSHLGNNKLEVFALTCRNRSSTIITIFSKLKVFYHPTSSSKTTPWPWPDQDNFWRSNNYSSLISIQKSNHV